MTHATEINMHKMYTTVKSMVASTGLELIAIDTILMSFPEEPSDAYCGDEQSAYLRAYNMMVPDRMFSEFDYSEWLYEMTTDIEFIRECERRFAKCEYFASVLGM